MNGLCLLEQCAQAEELSECATALHDVLAIPTDLHVDSTVQMLQGNSPWYGYSTKPMTDKLLC